MSILSSPFIIEYKTSGLLDTLGLLVNEELLYSGKLLIVGIHGHLNIIVRNEPIFSTSYQNSSLCQS